jgi:hypothetical protein
MRPRLKHNTSVLSINASRVPVQLLDLMQDIIYKYKNCSKLNTGLCTGACLLEWGWGQECQRFLNFGSELQLESRRCLSGLQKTLGLVPVLVRSLRRRVSLILHDMQ